MADQDADKGVTVEVWVNDEGEVHRDNGLPAVVVGGGVRREWYKHGQRHRDNGLPAVEDEFRGDQWWVEGTYQEMSEEAARERRRRQARKARDRVGRFQAKPCPTIKLTPLT